MCVSRKFYKAFHLFKLIKLFYSDNFTCQSMSSNPAEVMFSPWNNLQVASRVRRPKIIFNTLPRYFMESTLYSIWPLCKIHVKCLSATPSPQNEIITDVCVCVRIVYCNHKWQALSQIEFSYHVCISYLDDLMQHKRNSRALANALELRLFCIKPSICIWEMMSVLTFKFYTQG